MDIEPIPLWHGLSPQVRDESIHQNVSVHGLPHIPKSDVVAMDPTHARRWLDIGKQALALLSKAPRDALVRSPVADATPLGADHREQHSVDLVVVPRLALHKAVRFGVYVKEVGRSHFRNSAS